MTHLTDGEIEGFVGDRLSRANKRRVVSHLLTGCWSCSARLGKFGELLFPDDRGEGRARAKVEMARPIDKSYDGAIQRAWESAHAKLARFHQEELKLEAFWSASFEARYRDPRLMVKLAAEARSAVGQLDPVTFGPGVVADLQARAWGEYANALRVNGSYSEADHALDRADRLAEDGTGDPLLAARLNDFRASLRTDQHRLADAFQLLVLVEKSYRDLGEDHLAGRATISMGNLAYFEGDMEQAVALVRKGLSLLEPGRDSTLEALAEKNLIALLAGSGHFSEAGELLLRSGLRKRLMSEPLALVRIRWIEGQIAAGLGRLERASLILDSVREELSHHGRQYESAIVALELAAVWLRLGKLAEVRLLAEDTYLTLSQLGVGVEAVKAVSYLRDACRGQQPPLSAVTSVRDFLARLENRPELVFKPA